MAENYTDLKTLITNTAENDDDEFEDNLDAFIDMAERRLTKDMDSYGMVQIVSITTSAGDPLVSIPGTLQVNKGLYLRTDSGSRINLIYKVNEYINEYWPIRSSTASVAKYYGRFGAYKWILAPTMTSALNLEVEMVARPTALSATNETNWFTDFAWEALFYSCMIEACNFMKAYDAAKEWNAKYQEQIQMLRNEARRTRRDDQEIPQNPAGGENDLLGDK
jgi:hypothetical protein